MENGQASIEADVQSAEQNIRENVNTRTTGEANEIASQQLQTQATGTGIIPGIGTAASAEMQKKAIELGQAGNTRKVGATSCLGQLSNTITKLQNNANILTQLNTNVVGALNNFDELFGAWNGQIEPLIKSVGSIVGENGIAATTNELNKAVEADFKKIENGNSNNTGEQKNNSDNKDKETNTKQINNLETPNVQIKKPSFGIL